MEKIVYLLEDDESICELVKCTLDMNGIRCEYFNSIREFNKALEKATPSVALLDIMLGDGNGIDVLTNIKKLYPQVICIMILLLKKLLRIKPMTLLIPLLVQLV